LEFQHSPTRFTEISTEFRLADLKPMRFPGQLFLLYIPLRPAFWFWQHYLAAIASGVHGTAALWVVGRHVMREHRWRLENTKNERRTRYYDMLLTDQISAAEVRLYGLGAHFRSAFSDIRSKLRQGRLTLSKQEMQGEMIAGGLSWSGGVTGIAWMLFMVISGAARLGNLVLCYHSFMQGETLMRSLFESASRIYRSSLFLENLFEFLKAESVVPSPALPAALPSSLQQGVHFAEVSFSYPGSKRDSLSAFSMFMPAGSVTAVVGYNGAGKSTLSKLLCRFYNPASGAITLDGEDLRNFSVDELRRHISVLFQQPLNDHTTTEENIAFGDIAAHYDRTQIERSAKAAGADAPIQRLPVGYETVLGKWFGGAELN
jgi:ATP-binding cassette, subfamily B, bacterial